MALAMRDKVMVPVLRAMLALTICTAAASCTPGTPMRDGKWLREHQEEIRRDCQPILDALAGHKESNGKYPREEDSEFESHGEWLDSQNWNWTYFVEPDQSAFCLGIGDFDLDGISIVWCSRHGGWAMDSKENGLVPLEDDKKE